MIPRPVGSFLLSGSSTLKRIWFLIQFSVNLVFQSSILNFFSSNASFCILIYPRAAHNRCKKNNSRATQNGPKSVPMVLLWRRLRRFRVRAFPGELRFFDSASSKTAAVMISSSLVLLTCLVMVLLSLDSGMADRRFASVIDSTRLFASRAVSPKTQPLRVEEAL